MTATGLEPRTTYFINEHLSTLASLAKWLSVRLWIKWWWVRILLQSLKGTLIQIWKSPYIFMLIKKQYPENFALLTLRTLELFACEVCKFLKN